MNLADPQQWNGYTYANNNPLTLSDPTVLKPACGGQFDIPCATGGKGSTGGMGTGGGPTCGPRHTK
jgi:hypothetical protein